MIARYLLNAFIYDHSRAHRLMLEGIVRDYAKNNNMKLGAVISTIWPNRILDLSMSGYGLYFLNIDDLEKTMDGIKFGSQIRNNDLAGSIVYVAERDIFMTGRSDLAVCSLRSHVMAMSFLAKDSAQYKNEIQECIAVHVRKISMPTDGL